MASLITEMNMMMMGMRSFLVVSRGRSAAMESTSRGALSRFYSDKGRILSEEEQAKENVYIQVLLLYLELD